MNLNPTPMGRETGTATILNGASQSEAIDLGGHVMVAIAMPAAWTTANLTFAVATDAASSYNPMFDSNGTEITIVAAANEYLQLSPAVFAGVRFVKIRSGTNGTPVTQGADRVLTVVGRSIA